MLRSVFERIPQILTRGLVLITVSAIVVLSSISPSRGHTASISGQVIASISLFLEKLGGIFSRSWLGPQAQRIGTAGHHVLGWVAHLAGSLAVLPRLTIHRDSRLGAALPVIRALVSNGLRPCGVGT
ncbi:MAG: hypothetical protein ACT4NY_11780 [Pseudonocardiales bacterium]